MSSNKEEWQRIAAEFEERWDFPNCIGAIYVKHVLLKQPQDHIISTTKLPSA